MFCKAPNFNLQMVRLRVQSCGETFRIITAEVKRALQKRRNFDGVVVITRLGNASHGGLTINENADPSVRVDLKAALQELTLMQSKAVV